MTKGKLRGDRKNTVKMNKPGQHSIYVLPQSISVWTKNGWTAVDDGTDDKDKGTTTTTVVSLPSGANDASKE